MVTASSRAPNRIGIQLVQLDQRGRGINRVHDVVERLGQFVNVFAIDGRHEGAIQARR